jgi:hypothetical protein
VFYGIPEYISEPIEIIMLRSNARIPVIPPDLPSFQSILFIPFSGCKFVIAVREFG